MPRKKKTKANRPKVPIKIKEALYCEAGNKCADPGCSSSLLELHHIKEWHVYKTHDAAHMIAVCPTCHTHAHHGLLQIDDATIRSWKSIQRSPSHQGHIYIEPGESCRVLLGSIFMTNGPKSTEGVTLFRFSSENKLGFRVSGGEILMMNLTITNSVGHELLRIVDSHIKHNAIEPVRYEERKGRARVTAPATTEYLPDWLTAKYNENPPASLVEDGRFTVLDIEVLDRGLVQVQGVWFEDQRAVVVTRDCLSVCLARTNGFVHIRGYGERRGEPKNLKKLPVCQYDGLIDYSVLGSVLHSGEL